MNIYLGKLDFETLIMKHNPLAFKTASGDIAYFNDYVDVYVELFTRLYMQFGKGYVDMVVFIVDNCGLPSLEAERYVKRMQQREGVPDPCLIDWSMGGLERDRTLLKLARGLHDMTDTALSSASFHTALGIWKEKVCINN